MLLKIRHGILEITNYPNTKISAIIINVRFILSSGSVLEPFIKPLGVVEQCSASKIIENLQNNFLINVQEDSDESKLLNSLNYQITFDQRTLVNQPQILTRHYAKLLYLFSCREVSQYIRHICATGAEFNGSQRDFFLGSFVVLSIQRSSEQNDFDRFITYIKHYLTFAYNAEKLDDVLTICTPFGIEEFYKTIHFGKVSNLINSNGSLFALSNTLPSGCEGSAVFNNKLRLIGIIICTTFQRHDKNVNLTLAASFSYVLRDFLNKLGISVKPIEMPRRLSNFQWERSLVAVITNNQQCTGTLVKILNKSFILTCSHVMHNNDSPIITCRSAYGNFPAELVWKNPNFDQPFDVALLKPNLNIPNKYFVKLATSRPHSGQMIYNAGFPFFDDLQHDFNPSIFEGRIIKYSTKSIISDGCVQDGQSGGPMFDRNGCVLGICVSNLRSDGVIFPNCNTAVPIICIRHILEQYAKTDNVTVLDSLITNDTLPTSSPIQSKL